MSFGKCEVIGCSSPVWNGWRIKNKTRVFKVCEDHLRRHWDKKNDFNLRRAFRLDAYTEPVKSRLACGCGAELVKGHRICSECKAERKRQRSREAYYKPKELAPVVPNLIYLRFCKNDGCEKERKSGHSYCEKCAARRKKQSNRIRQRRFAECVV